MELNSREIAILIWLTASFCLMLFAPKVRVSMWNVVRAFLDKEILLVVTAMVIYVAACVALLGFMGVWQEANLKTTLVWGITFAFLTTMTGNRIAEDRKEFERIIQEIIGATSIVIFVAEFYTFPFLMELFLVPALFALTFSVALAEARPEYAPAAKLLTGVQNIAGISILGFSVYMIAINLHDFASIQTALEFAVPILLSLMFLPFLFVLTVVMTYDNAFVAAQFGLKDRALRTYAMREAFLAFGLDIDFLKRWMRNVRSIESPDRESIKQSILELKAIKLRERNPPVIERSQGWSPYEAMEFLGDQLAMGD